MSNKIPEWIERAATKAVDDIVFREDVDDFAYAKQIIIREINRAAPPLWEPISNLGSIGDKEMVIAVTAAGRMMQVTQFLLEGMLDKATPQHLRFPATHFCRLAPPTS